MRKIIVFILFLVISAIAFAQECEDKEYPPLALGDSIRKVHEANLKQAQAKYMNDSTDAEHIIWYGRRLAYLGRYKEAIDVYTKGIKLFPKDARFLRHRGHRYITLRCFDKAIADLKLAADLTKNQTDEIEEDGIPNAMNMPTSTLQTNIWYHLGLAYYLTGNFEKALPAYKECSRIAENSDMYVAAVNWEYITLRKLKRDKEADALLITIKPGIEIIENKDYLDILLMYRNKDEKALVEKTRAQETISSATLGFALGNYYLLKGEQDKAIDIFRKITGGNQWSSFGFIAAEAELGRLK